jgi:Family of unknown function (DUF6941)
MISCRVALVAEIVSRDAEVNTLTIVNVIEEVHAAAFPIVINRLTALFLLQRDAADAPVDARLRARLGDRELGTFPIALDFEDKLKTRVIATIRGLVVPGPGNVSVALETDGRQLGVWEFPIDQLDGPRIELNAE